MNLQKSKLLILPLVVINLLSCKKFEKVDFQQAWSPDLAIPLANSTFGVYDVFAKTDSSDLIVTNENTGEISIVYRKVVASSNADELFGKIDFNETFVYNVSELELVPQINFSGTVNSFRTEILDFQTEDGVELDQVSFNSGFFNINLRTILKHDLNVTLTFPTLKNGNTPITRQVFLEYQGTVPTQTEVLIDLTDLNGDFTLNGTDHNKLEVDIQATVIGNGVEDIDGTEIFRAELTSDNIKFHNMTGYFGQTSLMDVQDSVLLKIFKDADIQGHFEFTNPKVNFIVTNSFGIPIDLHLNNLQTIQTFPGGTNLPLFGFPTPEEITAPAQVGQETVTTLELTNQNTTNLNSIITPTPKYFYYEASALPNPQGKTAIPNFIDETSQVEIVAEVNMPLEGYAYDFIVQDTVDFKLNQEVEKIESVMFRLIGDNGFPVFFNTQVTAYDKNFVKMFDLFDENQALIDGAPVDNNGKVTTSTRKITDINITENQLKNIDKIEKLIIRGEVRTTGLNENNIPNSQNVKFYDYYKLALKLSLNLKLK